MLRCLIFLLPALLTAAVGPESTLLAINGASPASLAVGNAWISLRQIPIEHVVVLNTVPAGSHCSRENFLRHILAPLRAAVRERGLGGQISAIAFAPDFPVAIHMGLAKVPPQVGNHGSLTGMTALGGQVLAGDGGWVELRANRSYQHPDGMAVQPLVPWTLLGEFAAVAACFKSKDYATAQVKLLDLEQQLPGHAGVLYDLACAQAQTQQIELALETLTRAVDAGFTDGKWLQQDSDLASLHDRPAFAALVTRLSHFTIKPPLTLPFTASPDWLDESSTAEDATLLPSISLGLTSGDGLGVTATIANLARAVAADGSRPAGTIYCLRNGNVRSTTREWAFSALCEALNDLGIAAIVSDGVLPEHAPAVAGAVIGSASFAWAGSRSTILPGAICEHLTSCGGMVWPGAGQTHLTEWLRHGAAGSSGTVDEPYAIQAKFPTPFIQLHYARGVSLIEAFYLSVSGPYQLLIVGEPLCAPWARPVPISVSDENHAPHGDHLQAVEVWLDGHRRATVAPGAALPTWERLPAGDHDLRLVCLPRSAELQPARLMRRLTIAGPALTVDAPTTLQLDQPLRIRARCAGAHQLRLRGVSGILASADAGSDTALLHCRAQQLGLGPVLLRLEALTADGTIIAQTSVPLTIAPAPRLAARPRPPALQPGPLVTCNGTTKVPSSACEGPAWLAETGLENQPGTVDAWFQLDHDGLWQAQWLGTRVSSIALDGQLPQATGPEGWLLLDLAAGWHHLRFTLNAGPGPCSLRIGHDGTWPLDAQRAHH